MLIWATGHYTVPHYQKSNLVSFDFKINVKISSVNQQLVGQVFCNLFALDVNNLAYLPEQFCCHHAQTQDLDLKSMYLVLWLPFFLNRSLFDIFSHADNYDSHHEEVNPKMKVCKLLITAKYTFRSEISDCIYKYIRLEIIFNHQR